MNTLQQYRYTPPGLGFKLFGRTITIGSIIKKVLDKAIDFACAQANVFTGGLFTDTIKKASDRLKAVTASLEKALSPTAKLLNVSGGLSAQEENALAAWTEQKLMPYIQMLTSRFEEVKLAPTRTEQLAILSEMALAMDTIQTHFDNYDNSTLSTLGKDTRAFIISNALFPVNEIVQEMVKQIGAQVVPTSGNPQKMAQEEAFMPLFTTTPLTAVATEMYKMPAGTPGTTTGTTLPTTNTTLPVSNPTTTTGGKTGTAIKITPDVIQAQKDSNLVWDKNGNASVKKTGNNTALIVGGVVLGGIVIYAATRKKKPASGMNGRAKKPRAGYSKKK